MLPLFCSFLQMGSCRQSGGGTYIERRSSRRDGLSERPRESCGMRIRSTRYQFGDALSLAQAIEQA